MELLANSGYSARDVERLLLGLSREGAKGKMQLLSLCQWLSELQAVQMPGFLANEA